MVHGGGVVVLLRARNPRAPMRSNGPVILSRTMFVGRALCSVLGVEVSVSKCKVTTGGPPVRGTLSLKLIIALKRARACMLLII